MNQEQEFFEANRALWNEKTKHHVASEFYDMKGFLDGNNTLREPELELLGDVHGKSILHLQCHFGQDTLSLARMGANVMGTDISEDAIAYAIDLCEQIGVTGRFKVTDTYSVPDNVKEQFDIVFMSYGVIGWLPDMQRWANVVAHMLKPGGSMVFVEFHPVVWMFDYDFSKVAYCYFNNGPIIETLQGTYADKNADISMKEIGWNHSMSEVLQALTDAGLKIEVFKEYDYASQDCFNNTVKVGDYKWQIKGMEGMLPIMYGIKATKPE